MTKAPLSEDSPKVFHALARFLGPAELHAIEADYARARNLGGNVELKLEREEGVSFNPRLARLLVILIYDLHVTELAVLRATLYAAVGYSGLIDVACTSEESLKEVPADVVPVVRAVCDNGSRDGSANLIRGVIVLDSVRHLHQSAWTFHERALILERAEAVVVSAHQANVPELLYQKLSHAITMQRQRLSRDVGENEEPYGG